MILGWRAVESSSHPGEIVYENAFTGEKISWEPSQKAAENPGESPDLNPPGM